jgi:peptidoglycan/xylan/chitin deacetylase (PgdA/CDA1 family)
MILTFLFIIIVCLYLAIQYGLFLPSVKGLPVFMYHKVSSNANDPLTISVENLEKQFSYLSKKGYTNLSLGQIIDNSNTKLPKRAFILTFDDGYLNNLKYLYPLLQKYNFHATIMLPVSLIGKTNEWDEGKESLMNYSQLLSMDSRYISFGLHTYRHLALKDMPIKAIMDDIEKCKQDLDHNGVKFLPVLAYPYGSYPRDKGEKEKFFTLLKQSGIVYGLRIGNRINRWPLRNRFEVKRIDIKGNDSFWEFKTKLKKGRVKMF